MEQPQRAEPPDTVSFIACNTKVRVGSRPLFTAFTKVRESLDFALVINASLTLLAPIIGFTFSMALSRYDQRKDYEEEESNAIGTEYVRADFLPTQMQQTFAIYWSGISNSDSLLAMGRGSANQIAARTTFVPRRRQMVVSQVRRRDSRIAGKEVTVFNSFAAVGLFDGVYLV